MRAETRRTTPAATLVRVGVATLLTAITLAWGCADFESTVDPTGGLPDVEVANPSFANDIQPIFVRRCAIGGCHSLNSARADLLHRGNEAAVLLDPLAGKTSVVPRCSCSRIGASPALGRLAATAEAG